MLLLIRNYNTNKIWVYTLNKGIVPEMNPNEGIINEIDHLGGRICILPETNWQRVKAMEETVCTIWSLFYANKNFLNTDGYKSLYTVVDAFFEKLYDASHLITSKELKRLLGGGE